jgi:NADPH:quinone reductase-like Zn-dependent oxidoreductase
MMKAVVLNRQIPQGIELVEVPKPSCGVGEALVRIKAAALNHRDEWCRKGQYANLRDGAILGSDGAGIVEEIAPDVDSSWLGKEVIINPALNWGNYQAAQDKAFGILGVPRDGTLAEYVVVPADRLVSKPVHLTWEEAAGLPLAGVTAYRALFYQGKLQAGEQVLVTGFGGGVAQFAAQFALAAGAFLAVSSGSVSKLQRAKKAGASLALNYLDPNWPKEALESCGGFDLIIDGASGDAINQLLQVCNPGGRIVIYGATLGPPGKVEARRIFWNQLHLIGSTMGSDQDFADMIAFVQTHQIHPIIDQTFSLAESFDAFERMKAGDQLGKIVIIP